MSKASMVIIFFLAIIFTFVTNRVVAQPPTKPTFRDAICETEFGNYTTTEYAKSLETVLVTLIQQANSSSTFHSTSAGTGSDTVYGQYYCRGDIPSELCSRCVLQAATAALLSCPKAKAAVAYFEVCTLHYENQPVLGVESILPPSASYTDSNVTDPSSFFAAANSTFSALVAEAVSGTGKFATGEGAISGTETVYCLVQCSPDLNATQCDSCLGWAADFMMRCCGKWPSIMYMFLPSCQMMYNTRAAFYYSTTVSSTPVSPSAMPPAPPLHSVRITRTPAKP